MKIKFKKLYANCADSSFKSAFYIKKENFIKKINEYVQRDLVEDIIFSNVPSETKEIVEEETPDEKSKKFADGVKSMRLTDEELDEIKKSCAEIENVELRETLIRAAISREKLEKYRRKIGWHDCANCGTICAPEDVLCEKCRRLKYEKFHNYVIKLLKKQPWLTFAEVKNNVEENVPKLLDECTPESVSSLRSQMVQYLCRSLNNENQNAINLLVMLFKCVKPEDLTEKLIKNTLYELRYDLPMKGRLKLVDR